MKASEALIIGEGEHRYEFIDQWGTLPRGHAFGITHAVVEDARGRILIHHARPEPDQDSIYVFTPEGEFLEAWGGDYATGAHGMHYRREAEGEFLYLAATTQGFVAKVSLAGEEVLRIGTPPRPDIYGPDTPFVPTQAAVASSGNIYVADGYGQCWVHQFSAGGEYIRSWGGRGAEPGQFQTPHGIMIDTRGAEERVLVSDRRNIRLQSFSLEGELLDIHTDHLRWPCATIQWQGCLYIPELYSRLTILDEHGGLLAHLGDRPGCWQREDWPNLPPAQWEPGRFSSPHDLHVDAAGNIYVVEWMPNFTGKVTKLVRLRN